MSSAKNPVEERQCIAAIDAASSCYTSSTASDWQAAGDGMWVKEIYADVRRGERTLLFRMEPNSFSPPHSHEELEQVYVLEGSFYDEHKLLRAGDFCVRSPGAVHSAASDDGAVMLVVYTKA